MIWIALAIYYALGMLAIHKASPKRDPRFRDADLYSIFLGYLLILQIWIIPCSMGLIGRGISKIRKGN